MTTFPQELLDLRATLEKARTAWSENCCNRPQPDDIAGLIQWDVRDRQCEEAVMAARRAYDEALAQYTALDGAA